MSKSLIVLNTQSLEVDTFGDASPLKTTPKARVLLLVSDQPFWAKVPGAIQLPNGGSVPSHAQGIYVPANTPTVLVEPASGALSLASNAAPGSPSIVNVSEVEYGYAD